MMTKTLMIDVIVITMMNVKMKTSIFTRIHERCFMMKEIQRSESEIILEKINSNFYYIISFSISYL